MHRTLVPLLITSVMTCTQGSFAASPERFVVSAEALVNTFDGSARRECTVQTEVESGKAQEAWIAFGTVKPHENQGWAVMSSTTRCGSGSFARARDLFGQALGVPYMIIDLNTIPAVSSAEKVGVQTTLEVQKLSAFDDEGQSVYTRSQHVRTLALATGEQGAVPLLLADPHETESFNIYELFLQLSAWSMGQRMAAYGTIAVTANVPGVNIFLDGGLVGRTQEEAPIVLKNVLVSSHEVRVQDFSGHVAAKQVAVEKGKVIEADFSLLNLPAKSSSVELIPLGKNPQGYEEYWRTRDGAFVVQVPAGEFLMGSPDEEGEPAERPQRRVFVSEFLIDKTEVTWRQFQKFVKATAAALPPIPLWGTPNDYAVSNVLHEEAKAYCEWVGGRLPTEAEWEKAARGTEGRQYPWGNEWDMDRCHSQDGAPHRPENVGSFPGCVSPYGVLDMAGGVFEWCADWYAEGYPDGPTRDPQGPQSGDGRVVRGGAWHSMSTALRSAYRLRNAPDWRSVQNGFRCVQKAPAGERGK